MKPRRNPDLIILTNPGKAPRAAPKGSLWERFHLRDGANARMVQVPDIAGVPRHVMALGLCEGLEFENGKRVMFRPELEDGPWLVGSNDRALYIVGRGSVPLNGLQGRKVAAVMYWPNEESAKHDAVRGFHHIFGEGGRRPEHDWPRAFPTLQGIAGTTRAYRLAGGEYRITPAGIVG